MIESLKRIESMCENLGLTEVQAKVAEIRISLENIDFSKIKVMYDNYVICQIKTPLYALELNQEAYRGLIGSKLYFGGAYTFTAGSIGKNIT